MRRGTRAVLSILVALVVSAPLAPVRAAPAPRDTVSVDKTAGYARILFTFQTAAPVTASVADGVLTIRLTRAVDTTIDRVTDALSTYVSNGRRDEDGLTYRFALSRPVALHTSTVLNKSVVDLVPDSYKGVPPDLPPAPPPVVKAEAVDVSKLPVIKVRVGEYANFTRLVFDWPQNVAYQPYPGAGRISLRFETLARPDFSMLDARKPAWLRSAGWRIEGNATIVDFDTDAESAYHDFRDGAKIAIDILAPKTDASAYAPPGALAAVPITPLPRSPAAAPPLVKGSDQAAALAAGAAIEALQKKAGVAPPAPAAAAAAPPPMVTAMGPEMSPPTAELTRDGALLRFPDARGHAVAVFARGPAIWIVLEGHPAFDVASLLAPVVSLVERAEASQVAGAAVLRLVFKSPLLATVAESDSALTVDFAASSTMPPAGIAFTRQGADGRSTLTTTLPGATRAIAVSDTEAGDHFFVVPARPGKANLTAKRFVELMAPPTAAGLAVMPLSDDLSVQVQDELVTFSRPRGLALSAASGASAEPIVQTVTSKQGAAFIDFAQWAKAGGPKIYEAIQNLRTAIARLPESSANAARIQLARYLIANEMGPEALGEIRLMEAADPKLASEPNMLAMKGAAQYMMGRYGDARTALSSGSLNADPHAAFWRGMAEAKLGDYTNARRDLAQAQTVLRYYPPVWQTRARLARAATGIAQGDLASANDALDQLAPDAGTRESVEARLYAAQLLGAQGHVNEAIARLTALEAADYAPIAVRAAYARVDMQLKAKKIAAKDAIETLERLRYRWRGDTLELNVLRQLGSLYFAAKNWREGLGILRTAAVNFPDAELGREAQDDMRRAFSDLFLGDKADGMPPVQSLALFYDFVELTPIGRDGDEMIRRLADRLVTVDLLGPAEQLLDHQVKERLDGVARAQVASKLAMIYLLDRKFKEALATINETRQTRLPDELNEERRILEGRALAGMKQYDAAIDLIADDDSHDAARLRADIAWESQNWKVAGTRIEELLGNRWNVSGALAPEERADVMRTAVAYSLGNDQASLDRLREHYGEKMNASADAKSFGVVVTPIDRQGVAFRDLAKTIAAVDTLQAFMAEFKKNAGATPAQPAKTASN
jgi:hypothetical protein